MNAASAKRAQAGIARRGSLVSFRRGASRADVPAAFASSGADNVLVPGITSGQRRLVVSALDLEAAGFPVPMKGDRVVLGGDRHTTITTVDTNHREYQGCYDVMVAGI